jgi:hypothetical protein
LNQKKEPVSRVVLVSQEEQQVAFGSTTDGVFIKSLPGTYTITLKKLGFSAVVEQIIIEKDALLTLRCFPN